MPNAKPQRRRAGVLQALLLVAAAAAVVLLTQRALAEQLGGWIAGVWIAAMGAVMSILGVFFGG